MPTPEEAQRQIGLARLAHDRGDLLLHITLDVSRLAGEKSAWGSSENLIQVDESVGYFLSEIERVGWRLEHTGYAFVESGATTSGRILGTGEGVVNHGVVSGSFTFRRAAS
ncbi:hypothetical protein [Microbacterium sp. gxy059]|uniref:hypothetical protein n=1 Tax=Microbacterium sp. gxy059 TaxID=2957199 RepID=UPI003D97FA60